MYLHLEEKPVDFLYDTPLVHQSFFWSQIKRQQGFHTYAFDIKVKQQECDGKTSSAYLLDDLLLMEQDHPLAAVRTKEITKWCASDDFSKIQQALQMPDTHRCPKCGALVEKDWLYCQNCGAKLDEGGA